MFDSPRPAAEGNRLLTPYVPRLVIDWLQNEPETTHRAVEGTAVFADISGFTNLTEKLARRGKAGAEEMGDVLNAMFEELLGAAYQYGAGLIKWGGDAVLLLFDNPRHAEMACRAAFDMQAVIRRIGHLQTSSGSVRLRMSIGIHSGPLDFFLVGDRFRELIITGPGASTTAQMETTADAGQIVVSQGTAAALGDHATTLLGEGKGTGRVLVAAPDVPRDPRLTPASVEVDLSQAFCTPLREHLLAGTVDAEHRNVAVAFIEFQGANALLADAGAEAMTAAVTQFVNNCQVAAEENDVTFLASDIIDDGAKVILLAGAPKNVGDAEARVLTATRSVIDEAGILPLKAGVNRGRVFAGDYGPSYRRVYSVTGDIVNLAARLMAKAHHGEIVVALPVLGQSRTKFEAVPLEPFMVKGKTQPIDAVMLGKIVESQAPSITQLPLIGREEELSVLVAAEQSALAGQGHVVEIVGPAGIGKSRLLDEMVSKTSAEVLWANGDIYQRSTPFLPLQRVFRQQLGLGSEPDPERAAHALQNLVDRIAPELTPWLPLIGIAAGADFPMTEEVRVMSPEARKERLEWATSEALGHLYTSPTVFVFNDLYFMDTATIDVVRRLGADAVDRPWLVVATRRTEGQTVFDEQPHVDVLNLAPLGPAAADRLLQVATSGAPLPTHRLEALGERSGGNPLFLLELAAGASELDELPDSVEGVISARIDVLEPDLRRLLRSAAVVGMSVDLAMLEAVLSIDAAVDAAPLDRLHAVSEFLTPTSPGHVEFVHHLVRDTAYEGLPFRRRAVLHARIVDVLEAQYGDGVDTHAALLSQHCFYGDRFHAAWEYSRSAANKAREVYANADAAVLYRRALASADRLPSVNQGELTTVYKSLGEVYDDLGEFDAAEKILIRARGVSANDPMESGSVELNLAIIRQRMGRPEVALRGLTRALKALEGMDGNEACSLRAALLTRYAWTRNFQGKPRETIRWANRGIDEATTCSNESLVALCLEIIEWAHMGIGEFSEDSPALRALKVYEKLEDLPGQASTYNTLGAREYYRGNWDLALSYYAKSLEAYRKCGTSWGTVAPMASEAEVLCDQGRVELAEAMALEALQISRGANMPNDVAFVRTLLGRIATQQMRFEEARAHLSEAAEYYTATGVTSLLLQNQGFVAECLLHEGKSKEALDMVDAALQVAKGAEGVEFVLPLLERVHGVALARTGHESEGVDDLVTCAKTARERGALPELTWVLRDLVSLADADRADREGWNAELEHLRRQLGVVQLP